MKANWLANIFKYIHEVIVAADEPIFMSISVALPFIAPLLPALITGDNLQRYLFPEHPGWVWIGVIAFEMVAILAQTFVVSAKMKLADDPENPALKSESARASWAYNIYLATLVSSNVVLDLANNVGLVRVFVIGCLTVGLSLSASLINASRIYERDQKNKEERLQSNFEHNQKEEKALKRAYQLEKYRIKAARFQNPSESDMKVPQDFQNSFESDTKTGRPPIHENRVFAYMDENLNLVKRTYPSFTEVAKALNLPEATASRLRNKWIQKKQREFDSGSK